MMNVSDLKVKIFADTADPKAIAEAIKNPIISGVTTNPSLAKKAGCVDYWNFVNHVASLVNPRPVSFEVLSDDANEMRRQAKKLACVSTNVFVKIPFLNTKGENNLAVVRDLVADGVNLNLTAVLTMRQCEEGVAALANGKSSFLSVFSGRISDTGRNSCDYIRHAVDEARGTNVGVLWASIRSQFDIVQADQCGAAAITIFPEMVKKLSLFGKDLTEFAKETTQMFVSDAVSAGFTL